MLKSFQIANFKSFGSKLQDIPLKPITLIFGPNSAGKSSIIHSLLWLNHATAVEELDVRHPKAGKGQVDLGGFWKFLHKRDPSKRVLVSFKFGPEILKNAQDCWWDIKENITVELSFGRRVNGEYSHPQMLDLRLVLDDQILLTASRSADNAIKINSLDFKHPAMRECITKMALKSFIFPTQALFGTSLFTEIICSKK